MIRCEIARLPRRKLNLIAPGTMSVNRGRGEWDNWQLPNRSTQKALSSIGRIYLDMMLHWTYERVLN